MHRKVRFLNSAERGRQETYSTDFTHQLIARGFSVEAIEKLQDDAIEAVVLRFLDDKFAHIATGGA